MHKNLVTSPRRYLIQPAIVRGVSIIIGILLRTYGYEIIPVWYNKNIRSNTLIPFNNVCIERFLTALSLASTLYSNKCTYRHKTRKAWCNYRNIIFIHITYKHERAFNIIPMYYFLLVFIWPLKVPLIGSVYFWSKSLCHAWSSNTLWKLILTLLHYTIYRIYTLLGI